MTSQKICNHVKVISEVKTNVGGVCEECAKQNSQWVHLRTCQTCGVTLCCDSSPNKHMTQHYHQTQHPVVASSEPGERWLWCYPDELLVGY